MFVQRTFLLIASDQRRRKPRAHEAPPTSRAVLRCSGRNSPAHRGTVRRDAPEVRDRVGRWGLSPSRAVETCTCGRLADTTARFRPDPRRPSLLERLFDTRVGTESSGAARFEGMRSNGGTGSARGGFRSIRALKRAPVVAERTPLHVSDPDGRPTGGRSAGSGLGDEGGGDDASGEGRAADVDRHGRAVLDVGREESERDPAAEHR